MANELDISFGLRAKSISYVVSSAFITKKAIERWRFED